MNLKKIEKHLRSQINIKFIQIFDNSLFHNHSEKGLTHLKIIIISDDFSDQKPIKRHRMMFSFLSEIIKKKIYSITLNTYTSNEWEHKKYNLNNDSKCFKSK